MLRFFDLVLSTLTFGLVCGFSTYNGKKSSCDVVYINAGITKEGARAVLFSSGGISIVLGVSPQSTSSVT